MTERAQQNALSAHGERPTASFLTASLAAPSMDICRVIFAAVVIVAVSGLLAIALSFL